MQKRTIPCLIAAGFLSFALTVSATQAFAAPQWGDVVVKGRKIDPESQRIVRYGDLNLTQASDRHRLDRRIYRTANSLCFYMNGSESADCTLLAVRSTDEQVAQAVDRAYRQMAGLPVGPALQISMVIAH